MNVPLSVTPEEKHQKEKLNIWKNGKKIIKDAPIYPYFYTDKEFNIPSAINVSTIEKIALSDFQYRTFYKYEFLTRDDLVQARNRLNHNKIDIAFEANIPFIIRNRIDNPDIYTEYPHTDPIKFHFLDIEQDTPPDKMFPTPDDIITSVTFAGSDKKLRSIYVSKFENGDYKLLETYMNIYTKDKPDIIVLYNKSYDMPVILGRCKRHKISTKLFSKSTAEPFVGGKHGVNIDGTIVYDIYDSSKADQSLTGNVPSRTLKYVSDYFGFKTDIEVIDFETVDSRMLIGTKKLVSYNQDDVRRLLHLFNIYWDEIEYKANDLKIPMNEAVDLGVSDLALVVLGDLYREHDIIADGSNYTRFPEIFQREKENDEKNYQGALSEIYQNGLFIPVHKADYGSMYPNILSEFNFSPDTCKLLRYDDYDKDAFRFEELEDTIIYHIPDNQIHKTVVLECKKEKGFLSVAVKRFLDERSTFKKKWKETGKKKYRSRSDISKVKANGGIYGVMGASHHPFGFVPAAIGTTGIGRICAQLLIDVLEDLYPGSVIEVDTDGVYFTATDIDEDLIIKKFNEALFKTFNRALNLTIDIDSYDKGYFHKAKNYILKKGDNIILHGASMKSSKMCPMERKFIKEIAEAKLANEPTDPIVAHYLEDMETFPLRDFAMQVSLGKHIHQYKSQNSIGVRMALAAKYHYQIEPELGNEYFYVKITTGYELYQICKKERLDINYYKKKIKDITKRLDIELKETEHIEDFL